MANQHRQFEHVFRYKSKSVRLLCAIEHRAGSRQLILEDVYATVPGIADEVPDWRIELEACKAAWDRRAIYR